MISIISIVPMYIYNGINRWSLDMNKEKCEFVSIINEYSRIKVTVDNVDQLDLIDDCGFDSIQMIEFICSVEDVFGIELGEEYMLADEIRNLRSFWGYIMRKISGV